MGRKVAEKGKTGHIGQVTLDDDQHKAIDYLAEQLGTSRSKTLARFVPSRAMAEMFADFALQRKWMPEYFTQVALAQFIRGILTDKGVGKLRVHPDNLPLPTDADGHAKMMIIWRRCISNLKSPGDEPGYRAIPCEWPEEEG